MVKDRDRISNLPPEVIIHILSFLPSTELRAQTSVLSKKWRHLWSSTPFLDFSPSISAPTIDLCLRMYTNPALRRLRIESSSAEFRTPIGFDHWIRFAASRSVNELALSLRDGPYSYSYKPHLPPSLFLCSRSLSSLKLRICTFPQIDEDFLGFPSLKTLILEYVVISDEAVDFLISKSPLLETLNLNCCPEIGRIEISSARNPRIENLKLSICRMEEGGDQVLVDAPCLRFFHYKGKIEKLKLRDAPRLVGAEISGFISELCKSKEQWMGIISAISSVEVLSVSYWFFQFVLSEEDDDLFEIRGPMFKNLKELRWDGHGLVVTKNSRRAIIFFLRECPLLEALYLHLDFYSGMMYEEHFLKYHYEEMYYNLEPVEREALEPFKGDELSFESNKDKQLKQLLKDDGYLLPQLTLVSITEFSDYEEEMQLVEFILRKAISLELLYLTDLSRFVEMEPLRGRIFRIPSASPNLKIDMWNKSTMKPREFRTYRHLWDF